MDTRILTPSGRSVVPIYAGAFLTLNSKNKLNDLFAFDSRIGWKRYCDHMTLKFRPTQEWVDSFKPHMGAEVSLVVSQYVSDANCYAVKVDSVGTLRVFVQSLFEEVRAPHITVACLENTKPKYAQGLVAQSGPKNFWMRAQFEFVARLGVFDAKTGRPFLGED